MKPVNRVRTGMGAALSSYLHVPQGCLHLRPYKEVA